MSTGQNNKVVVQLKETRDVLALAIVLGIAIKKSLENKEFDLSDLANFLPVVAKIGPAFENISNVKIELAAATREQAEELKTWVNENINLPEDKTTEDFIEDAFSVIADLWIIVNRYFLGGQLVANGTSPNPDMSEGNKKEIKESDENGYATVDEDTVTNAPTTA